MLGGPAIYIKQRFNKMRVGVERLPTADDVPKLLNTLNQARFFWLLIIISVEIIRAVLTFWSVIKKPAEAGFYTLCSFRLQ